MHILHVGLGASSERNADLFFKELLGLVKDAAVSLAAELGRSIFAINRELRIIHYKAEEIHFEVFIDPLFRAPEQSVLHTCLEVDDQAGFLKKCGAAGLKTSRTPKGDSFVSFISDFDGNSYEIKQKK
jgi:catechol 2,3-dioxygenase-like lactoylglutathione lyase family enzyme